MVGKQRDTASVLHRRTICFPESNLSTWNILTPIARTNGDLIVDVQVRRRLSSTSAAADKYHQRLIGVSLRKPHSCENYSDCVCLFVFIDRTSCDNILHIRHYQNSHYSTTTLVLDPAPLPAAIYMVQPEDGLCTRIAHTDLQTSNMRGSPPLRGTSLFNEGLWRERLST